MVARAWGERDEAKRPRPAVGTKREAAARKVALGSEEIFVHNDAVSLRLLVNRRAKTVRVIDFRAGASVAKRVFVLDFARREGLEKIYTLVERDEVSTWRKLGFAKEASLPAFYKRSDAFLLGTTADDAVMRARAPFFGDDEDDDDDEPAATKAAHDVAERTVAQAKRLARALEDRALSPVRVAPMTAPDARKAVDKALRAGRALTAFEPFGRDVERRYFSLAARGGIEIVASTESQPCFGNALLELLAAPSSEAERAATASAVRAMCGRLFAEGTIGCFSLTPSDDVGLSVAFLHGGFRRTGLLTSHLLVDGVRKDAIVWSRKLAPPTDT